ncbi:nucleoid-associated protein [Sphingobacterium sp. LRF_L2]|uniref:nucleoid-associated protein n=1 Tax=Sphingobacterium sp. LRF_L2 TaxID=3369421 RepID=UPI003F606543
MFFHQDANIKAVFVHRVGNKSQDEFYVLSDLPIDLKSDEVLPDLLMKYYTKPFQKINEVYRLHHQNDFSLNEVYNYVTQFFEGITDLGQLSEQLAKYLYDISEHPKIKSGEFHVVHFENVQMEGEVHDAIGIFKTENKNPVLKIHPKQQGFEFSHIEETINIDILDKGVIIVNTEAEEGYKVLITESKSVNEAVYWKDDFLKVMARNDNYQRTANILKVAKSFVMDKMDETFHIDLSDKSALLNKTVDYFKKKETFDQEEFGEEVFSNEQAIGMFLDYKKDFENEFETSIEDSFDISSSAVKKMQSSFKKVIKLDKNAQIILLGTRDILERGFDDEKGMSFYKVYFENEG